MRRLGLLLIILVGLNSLFVGNVIADLGDARLVNSFDIPDNGEVHSQDGLAWDGNNLWAVSHTDAQHHYLCRLTTDGTLIEQFPTNSIFYSGSVTGLDYRPGVGLLAKLRKRIYTTDIDGNRLSELSSSGAHRSIAYDEVNNTIISLMPYGGGVLVIFKDADMIPHPAWNNQWYYVHMGAIIPTGQAPGLLRGATYADGYLYVAHGNVYKVDITDKDAPVIVDVLEMPSGVEPAGLAAIDNTLLYVGVRDTGSGDLNQLHVYDMTTQDNDCGDYRTRRNDYRQLVIEANRDYNGKELAGELREILTDWWMLRRACHTVWFVRPFIASAKLMELAQADGLFEQSEQNTSWGEIKRGSVAGVLE